MLTTNSIDKVDSMVRKLSKESDKWQSLAIAIDLADEILKILLPNNREWQNQLDRDTQNTGRLPQPLSLDTFKNQKQVKWFNEHPESASARSAFKLFYAEDCALESNFFWFSESATKQRISVATEYSQNWEDSELTRKPQYKVGIDFFLTPDTNGVLLVISNHQKLRVLELRDHLSNTQKLIFKDKLDGAAAYTGIENGKQLEFEPQRTIHTTLWNALQLKEVNKQFYNYIAAHFAELVTSLEAMGKGEDDAKQFSSRLLGRLLFVWFLRKMDVINEAVGYFDVEELDATEYYEQKLKVLFFNTLNTEISDRSNGDLRTPYLNGGLFEAKENDFAKEKLIFPEGFFERLFAHFNEFNFTTDESSADFELIAVDPEMLGQVFETLLASQIDENESNERNKTGSFYTPREIVGYMVKETLRQYLYSKLDANAHAGIDELLDLSDSQWISRKSTSSVDVWGVKTKNIISKIKSALDSFKVIDIASGSGAFPMGMMQQLLKTYERIETNFDPYKLKLSIIENNIYGVDIQPMAVEISRLRAWLSVIVDETDKNNIQPLPNLDFKFIAANSLVKLEKGQTSLFDDPDLDLKLKDLRDKYFNARKPSTKKKYQEKYYNLTFGQISMFEDERTRQLKTFDPFKNRIAADFFDPYIMFGISDGFDAVIGNPPYIHLQKMKSRDPKSWEFYKENSKKLGFETYEAKGDLYTLFYEKGMDQIKKDGLLAFITSNKWMRAGYGKKLRNFFIEKTNPLELIDLGANVFDSATVDTNILILQKSDNKHQLRALALEENKTENMSDYIKQHAINLDYHTGESWIILNKIEQSIKKKIEAVGTPLKDWNIKINRGILTGLNEAFIISKKKRDELVEADPKSVEIIRPILRGRDIKRNKIDFQDKYLIALFPSKNYDIEKFPAIKDWLLNGDWVTAKTKTNPPTPIGSGKLRLEQTGETHTFKGVKFKSRKKTTNKWFEIQDSIQYWDDFNKPKIIYPETTQGAYFALDNKKFMLDKTCFMITNYENLTYLQCTLSSYLFEFAYKRIYASIELGIKGYQYNKYALTKLPVKKYSKNVALNNDDIFKLYSLTNEEINYITSSLGI